MNTGNSGTSPAPMVPLPESSGPAPHNSSFARVDGTGVADGAPKLTQDASFGKGRAGSSKETGGGNNS